MLPLLERLALELARDPWLPLELAREEAREPLARDEAREPEPERERDPERDLEIGREISVVATRTKLVRNLCI